MSSTGGGLPQAPGRLRYWKWGAVCFVLLSIIAGRWHFRRSRAAHQGALAGLLFSFMASARVARGPARMRRMVDGSVRPGRGAHCARPREPVRGRSVPRQPTRRCAGNCRQCCSEAGRRARGHSVRSASSAVSADSWRPSSRSSIKARHRRPCLTIRTRPGVEGCTYWVTMGCFRRGRASVAAQGDVPVHGARRLDDVPSNACIV